MEAEARAEAVVDEAATAVEATEAVVVMAAEAKAIAVHQTQRQKYLQLVYRRQAELHAPVASPIRMLSGIFVFNQVQEQPPGDV